ncbi:MAG: patatin-like phospholipase family protein [Pseudomonadota bacterium]
MKLEKLTRREFLGLSAITLATTLCGQSCSRGGRPGTIGLALGAGGARGLAHIPIVELFDELEIRPHRLAGSSMGAVIGVLYASGQSGAQIKQLIDDLVVRENESFLEALRKWEAFRWMEFVDPEIGNGGLLNAGKFVGFIQEAINRSTFEELDIPLKIVAADFWKREQVVFESGDLTPALQASIAIPGLFTPVLHQGRALVDGSAVNPVPYDLLLDDCDITIAVDVQGSWTPEEQLTPSWFDTAMGSNLIMQESIIREQLKRRSPSIYLKPALRDIRVLDFAKADAIYQQTASAKEMLRNRLKVFL